jgi:hypothetical protein
MVKANSESRFCENCRFSNLKSRAILFFIFVRLKGHCQTPMRSRHFQVNIDVYTLSVENFNVKSEKLPIYYRLSGHTDLNRGPLAPHASTLAKLRHAPNTAFISIVPDSGRRRKRTFLLPLVSLISDCFSVPVLTVCTVFAKI